MRLFFCVVSWICLWPLLMGPQVACGQNNGGGGNGGGGNGGSGNGNNNGGNAGGILIDPQGVVQDLSQEAISPARVKQLQKEFAGRVSSELTMTSESRCVSLNRLDAAINNAFKEGNDIPLEMFYLAGLVRIDGVFLDKRTGDVVITGPAGAFGPGDQNRVVNLESGRPCLRLDDLVESQAIVDQKAFVECSIDPVAERLVALQRYLQANSFPANAGIVKQRFAEMARILGLQSVRLDGVRKESHLAMALVEADYRMKRVSLGLDNPRVKGMVSHLAFLKPQGNSMQRLWFVPYYDGILTDKDRQVFELKGQRWQLVSQEEIVSAQGTRSDAATTRLTTERWAQLFTEKFPEIAESMTVFAELQNLADLMTVWALVRKFGLDREVAWEGFDVEQVRVAMPKFRVPEAVPTLVNIKPSGAVILGLVAGGVKIDPVHEVENMRLGDWEQRKLSERVDDRWWWDANVNE